MKTTLTVRNLADLSHTLLCKPESLGELDTAEKHRLFVTAMARLIADHCGGAVPEEAFVTEQGCRVQVVADDSLPPGGGVWGAMDGEVASGVPTKDLSVSQVRTGSAWAPSDNGVMVTHIPTGAWAQCTSERSSHGNREIALQELLANRVVIAYVARGAQMDTSLYPLSIAAVLQDARVYVDGAYECAFPDEGRNHQVLADIDDLLKRLKGA